MTNSQNNTTIVGDDYYEVGTQSFLIDDFTEALLGD